MPKHTPPAITTNTVIGQDIDLDVEDVRLADGTRLTRKVADQIVEDVRRSGGRPSLTGRKSASPQIAFRIAPEIRDRAVEIAAREHKSLSQLAREALEQRIKAS